MTNSFNIEQLNNLSDKEKEYVLNILKELSQDGNSDTYNKLLYEDYSEIPVDIETFLHDTQYLGRALTDEDGRFTVYPYWEKVLKDIFPNGIDTNFNTAIFTGAIGLGKSTIAVIAVLYQLYRMMCLKNPYTHYGIQEIDTITFAFMNITLDAAGGVAWNKCQNMLQMSPWFMERGSLTKSKDPEWVPPSGIELLIGSKPSHIIGRAVFACLDGDTIIKTTEGDFPISSLVDKSIIVPTLSDDGTIVNSDICTVKPTISTVEQYELELEDGTIIKCTPNHRFLLTNGEYKEAQDLTVDDDIVESNLCSKVGMVGIKATKKTILASPKQFYDVINANPYNNFFIKTNNSYIVSHNCFIDEVSFQRNMDVEKQKAYAQEIVSSASARMQSRFMKGEHNPTILLLASSKRTEQSYLETFIDKKKQNESKTTLVVDEPQWVIRTDKDSPIKFKVAVGNKFLSSEVLPLTATEELVKTYRDRGFKIIDVPMGYYENFLDDIDIALTDIAGISTSNSSRYIAGPRIAAIKKDYLKNPFTKEVIEVGNARDDKTQYSDFFDMSKVDKDMLHKPLYVHLDMSVSGDKTGIAGTWIKGKQAGAEAGKELHYQLAFSVAVKAPKGHQVSFEKNRIFIRWLREQGFNIKGISTDSYQSYDLRQQLEMENFKCDMISVDKLQDKVCIPYLYLKNTIYEERLEMYDTVLLTEELLGLERNNNSGKVDHSPSGINSKDIADALCGSLYNASLHAEEFAFDYSENLQTMLSANNGDANDLSQITIDFEEELKQAMQIHMPQEIVEPIQPPGQRPIPQTPQIDYGSLANGILVW